MPNLNFDPTQAVNNVTNDANKNRGTDMGADHASSQFLDVMMANVSTKPKEPKKASASEAQAATGVAKKQAVKNSTSKTETVKDIDTTSAASNDVPVKDTKAMKALQKVANFLLQADKDGKIDLPDDVAQKLQQFLAKGDNLNAGDMASFMHDFVDVFRNLKIAMPAAGSTDAAKSDLQWPDDVIGALDTLGMKNTVSTDKPVDMMQVLRTLKSLVNQSEKAAKDTLKDIQDEKDQAAMLPEDQVSLVMVGVTTNQPAAVAPPVKTDDAAASAQTAAAVDEQMSAQMNAQAAGLLADANKGQTGTATGDAEAEAALPELPAMAAMPAAPAADTAKPKKDALSLTDIAKGKGKEAVQEKNDARSDKTADKAETRAETAAKAAATSATPAPVAEAKPVVAVTPNVTNVAPVITVNEALGIKGLTSTVANAVQQQSRELASRPNEATQQVMAQIQQKAGGKAAQISLQLTPAELGRVEVRLEIRRDGQAHTVVIADKPETLALLQKDASHLERSLQQAGINANGENMSFNLRDQNQAQQFNQERKRFSRGDIADLAVKEVAVNVMAEAGVISDTRINYHA